MRFKPLEITRVFRFGRLILEVVWYVSWELALAQPQSQWVCLPRGIISNFKSGVWTTWHAYQAQRTRISTAKIIWKLHTPSWLQIPWRILNWFRHWTGLFLFIPQVLLVSKGFLRPPTCGESCRVQGTEMQPNKSWQKCRRMWAAFKQILMSKSSLLNKTRSHRNWSWLLMPWNIRDLAAGLAVLYLTWQQKIPHGSMKSPKTHFYIILPWAIYDIDVCSMVFPRFFLAKENLEKNS